MILPNVISPGNALTIIAHVRNAVKIGKTRLPVGSVEWANLCVRVSYEGESQCVSLYQMQVLHDIDVDDYLSGFSGKSKVPGNDRDARGARVKFAKRLYSSLSSNYFRNRPLAHRASRRPWRDRTATPGPSDTPGCVLSESTLAASRDAGLSICRVRQRSARYRDHEGA
jgi:hypothetical protein